ncbi:MAG: O-antigen ligase family protein, partial [Thermoanaerobaculia bacterium]|nr:O-antigen ligase family protein [Thermoanaerobaculia bacterium]
WIELPLGAGLPDVSFSRFAFVVLVSLVALAGDRLRGPARLGGAEIVGCLAVACIVITVARSGSPLQTVQATATRFLLPVLAFYLARRLITTRSRLVALTVGMCLLGGAAGTYTLYEYRTGEVRFVPNERELTERDLARAGDPDMRRIRGVAGSTGSMGRLLATTLLATLFLALERWRYRSRALALLTGLIALQCIALLATLSRAAWLGLVVGVAVLLLTHPSGRRLVLPALLAAALFLGVAGASRLGGQAVARLTDEVSTPQGRVARWVTGVAMWRERPILGWGSGGFPRHSRQYLPDFEGRHSGYNAVESDYLELLVEGGLVALLPYALFLGLPLAQSLGLQRRIGAGKPVGWLETQDLSLYWSTLACFLVVTSTAATNQPLIRTLVFAVTGAVVGLPSVLAADEGSGDR